MLQATRLNPEFPVKPDVKSLIAERVRGEFREMPGLTLTLAQAGRLWSLDSSTCRDVLRDLVDTGFLCVRPDGTYGRSSDLAARPMRMAKAAIELTEVQQPKGIAVRA
jgi:hypothetical protein